MWRGHLAENYVASKVNEHRLGVNKFRESVSEELLNVRVVDAASSSSSLIGTSTGRSTLVV